MQRIVDLCKKPGNKARRNLASFQLCYRLKAQPRCVENFVTVLQAAQQNWALLHSDWNWSLDSYGNIRKIQVPHGLWVKISNCNKGHPALSPQTQPKQINTKAVSLSAELDRQLNFPCKHQFFITTIWLLIFLVRKLYWNFAPETQLMSYIIHRRMVKILNCGRRN